MKDDEREEFDRIVAGLDLDLTFPEPEPEPDLEVAWEAEPEPLEPVLPAELDDADELDQYDDVSYRDAPPIRSSFSTEVRWAWLAMALTPVMVLADTFLGIGLSGNVTWTIVSISAAGLLYLFFQLPERNDPDGGAHL